MSKKSTKRSARNLFERETGIKTYNLITTNGTQCQITPMERTVFDGQQHRVKNIAASIYLNVPIEELGRVEQECGFKNCVHPSCLTIDGKSFKVTEGKVLAPDVDLDTPDHFGYIHGISVETWSKMTDEEKSLARKGEFDPRDGWEITTRVAQ